MPKITIPVPGMRNIKTSLAVLISLLSCTLLFKSEYPFYAAVAAVICVQSEIEASVKTGLNRLLGTFVGGGLGCLFLVAFKKVAHEILFYVLVTIGVTLLIYVMNLIHWTSAISICSVVFLSVVIVHNTENEAPFIFSLNRVLDTSIGVIIAILIDWLLPSKPDENPRNRIVLRRKKKTENTGEKEIPAEVLREVQQDSTDNHSDAPESLEGGGDLSPSGEDSIQRDAISDKDSGKDSLQDEGSTASPS